MTLQYMAAPVRREGRLIPRWQQGTLFVRGCWFLVEEKDLEAHRMAKVARFRAVDSIKDLLPPLYDATVVASKPDWMTITGFERIALSFTDSYVAYQQSWILIPAEVADREALRSAAAPPAPVADNPA